MVVFPLATVWKVLSVVSFQFLFISAAAFLGQRKLQYFPTEERPTLPSDIDPLYDSIQEFEVTAQDGTRCFCWHWPAPELTRAPVVPPSFDKKQSDALLSTMVASRERWGNIFQNCDVLLFHGNAGNRLDRLPWMHLLREGLGCSVTVLDYRGYGGSDGDPSEDGLIADGIAAARWLHNHTVSIGSGKRSFILFGESIGTAVAVAVAADKDVHADALVLQAGFSSCSDVGSNAYPFLPVQLLMLDRFDSLSRSLSLPSSLPVLCIHGTTDDVAPLRLGRALFDSLPCTRKRFVELPCGHNDVYTKDPNTYLQTLISYMGESRLA